MDVTPHCSVIVCECVAYIFMFYASEMFNINADSGKSEYLLIRTRAESLTQSGRGRLFRKILYLITSRKVRRVFK